MNNANYTKRRKSNKIRHIAVIMLYDLIIVFLILGIVYACGTGIKHLFGELTEFNYGVAFMPGGEIYEGELYASVDLDFNNYIRVMIDGEYWYIHPSNIAFKEVKGE